MSMLFLLALALPTSWATEESPLEEPEYTDFDQMRVGKTKHNDQLPTDVAMTKFLDMAGDFFAAREEPNGLDEAKMKIVDELFDSFDLNKDHLWSEAEFTEYFVKATRMERVWAQIADENNVVGKDAMMKYLRRMFAGKAKDKISSFVAVTQGIALTTTNLEVYIAEMADTFEYPVTWEAFKASQVHATWENLPGAKYDGMANEETMINYFFGPTKDIVTRMETLQLSAELSEFETVGDLIEEVSGVADRRRASVKEAILDSAVCMLGAIGDIFYNPLSKLMSAVGCLDLMLNAEGECGYESTFIPGNGVLSCLASFVPGVGLVNNINCVINNVQTIHAIGKSSPPRCKWFGEAPECGIHVCSGEYPQKRTFDDCGDGNRCERGTKVHCCEPFQYERAPLPTVTPAMRLYNKSGDSRPVCSPSCNLSRSGVCYQCTNGVSCRDCRYMRGATDCRPEYCIHMEDRCTNWKPMHACVGSIIGDYSVVSQTECVRKCRQNSRCNCVTWGVNSSKKCRLETGTYSTNRNVQRYSAVSMNECFYG